MNEASDRQLVGRFAVEGSVGRIALLKRNLLNRSIEMAQLSSLRRRMIEDTKIRNLTLAAQRSYMHAVAECSSQANDETRSPDCYSSR